MQRKHPFFYMVCSLAIPVALQSMLQSSFWMIDQFMIGQLGSASVAGVGMAGKFSSIFSFLISTVGTVAGIMISQYAGQKNRYEMKRSFYVNLFVGVGVALLFSVLCCLFPGRIMSLYTKDPAVKATSSAYLRILSGTFLPMVGGTLLATYFRCMEKAKLPLYVSIVSALVNTGLNYVLIFGKMGSPVLGAQGAAIATVASQYVNFLLMLFFLLREKDFRQKLPVCVEKHVSFNWKQYSAMLLPVLISETAWSIGENVYAMIYGRIGTEASAAMALVNPVQGLMIGALCGLSQAAGIVVGKSLGNKKYEEAYASSRRLLFYGLVGSAFLSLLTVLLSPFYVQIYRVEDTVKLLTQQILLAFALVAPVKVLNMILGGGVLRSGGKTKYVMGIDLIGTWGFGVPLGLLSAFVLKLSVPYVYLILSMEECVRLGISAAVFRKKTWMRSLSAEAERKK